MFLRKSIVREAQSARKFLAIQWVSTPSAETRQISTPAHSHGYKQDMKLGMHASSELVVQIKQNGEYGVETPLPRSFLGGLRHRITNLL